MRTSLSRPLRALLVDIAAIPPARPGRAERWASGARRIWTRLIESPRFPALLTWIFATWAVLSVVAVFELVLSLGLHIAGAQHGFGSDRFSDLRVVNIISLASSLVAAVLVGAGIRCMRAGRRLRGCCWFERSQLVSIFVTQVFAFVESQFGAVFGLAINLLLLATARQLVRSEVGAAEVRGGDRARGLPRGDAGPLTSSARPRSRRAREDIPAAHPPLRAAGGRSPQHRLATPLRSGERSHDCGKRAGRYRSCSTTPCPRWLGSAPRCRLASEARSPARARRLPRELRTAIATRGTPSGARPRIVSPTRPPQALRPGIRSAPARGI